MLPPYLRAGLAALAAALLLLLVLRVPGSRSRWELAAFFVFLLVTTLAALLPNREPWGFVGYLAVPWSAGLYALSLRTAGLRFAGRGGRWSLAMAAGAAAYAVPDLLGYRAALPNALFRLFLGAAAAAYPLILLLQAWGARRERSLLAFFASFLLLPAALGLDLLARAGLLRDLAVSWPAALAVLLVSGYRLAQEGYLLARGWEGLARRLAGREQQLAAARLRLREAEGGLDLADRLAAAGLLAGGAAHEFRGVLGLIRSAAEFGLRQPDQQSLRRSLELVLEQAEHGGRAAGELLEAVSRGAEPVPRSLRLPAEIEGLLRLVRATYRREGIRLSYSREPQVAALACRPELEHILLTLLRNAADSVRASGGTVSLRFAVVREPAAGAAPAVVVEVEDDGGGVAPELERRIFEPGVSGKGSSGLGLFLARSLAERSGGSLEYVPRPGGSLFRLLLPGGE